MKSRDPLANALLKRWFMLSACFFAVICSTAYSQEPKIGHTSKLFVDREVTKEVRRLIDMHSAGFKGEYDSKRLNNIDPLKGDVRWVGDKILNLAIYYWADRDTFTKDYLQEWCDKATDYEEWGNNNDLEISHLLFALAIVYDWYGDRFDPKLKAKIGAFIYRHTKYQYEYALKNQDRWRVDSYWQNHCWINHTSILASAIALEKDYPETGQWKAFSKSKIYKVLELQSKDGSNHEGLNYSIYGNIWLVRALTLLQQEDPEIFKKSDYLRTYYKYYKGYAVDNTYGSFFDTGDSPRYLWFNPCEIFLKLYHEFNSPEYKALYEYYRDGYKQINPGLFTAVYDLIPSSTNALLASSVPYYFSDNLGIYTERAGDPSQDKTAFLFKSGIPGGLSGHTTILEHPAYHMNLGHEHPDQNHFMIWNHGAYLISDTGYTNKKLTRDHNIVLVNGIGQLGEGEQWFKDSDINGTKFTDNAGLLPEKIYHSDFVTVVSADGAEFYPHNAGLTLFDRTIIWIKSIGFIVADDIKTREPSKIDLLFHSDHKIEIEAGDSAKFVGNGETVGHFQSLFPKEVSLSTQEHHVLSHDSGNDEKKGFVLDLSCSMKTNQQKFFSYISQGLNDSVATIHEYDDKFVIELSLNSLIQTVIYRKFEAKEFKYGNYVTDARVLVLSSAQGTNGHDVHVYQASFFQSSGQEYLNGHILQNRIVTVPNEKN